MFSAYTATGEGNVKSRDGFVYSSVSGDILFQFNISSLIGKQNRQGVRRNSTETVLKTINANLTSMLKCLQNKIFLENIFFFGFSEHKNVDV